MSDLPNKAELLARLDARWTELQRLISRQSPARLEAPLGDGWSTKVHLGHVTTWEQSLLALLGGEERAAAIGVPASVAATHDVDQINAFVAARTNGLPLSDVRRVAESVHADLRALLAGMSDEDLGRPYSHYQPNDPPYNPNPVAGWIAGNTFDHYDEHIGWIRDSLGAASD